MGQLYNEDWEHVDIEAFREAIIGNGVITGLQVTESSPAAMTVLVSAGQCTVDAVVYSESSGQNLNISNGDATHDRKDIIVYDVTAGNPAVVAGTPSAAPTPADIPAGDILLGIVLVEANESTSIVNADITEDRVYSNKRLPHTAISANTTLNDAHGVVTIDSSGGTKTATLPTAVGIKGKIYVLKKSDSSGNVSVVNGNGAETLDGSTTINLAAQYDSVVIQSDGANWVVIASEMTDNSVRDAVEAATDSNTFKDADHTKLNGIATGADVTGSNPPQSHAHAYHTNRTRRMWIPIMHSTYAGITEGYTFSASADDIMTLYFRMPSDYVSSAIPIFHYYLPAPSANSIELRADALFSEINSQVRTTHGTIDNPNVVTPGNNDYHFTYNFDSSLLTLATADDLIKLKIQRTGTSGSDTHTSVLYCTGVEIQYTADM